MFVLLSFLRGEAKMHGRIANRPFTGAEQIVESYAAEACNDPGAALVQIIADVLRDIDEAECQFAQQRRFISRGYVRFAAPATGERP